jgi:hypothetical protein
LKSSTDYIEQVIAKEVAAFEMEATRLLKNTVKRHRFSGELQNSLDIQVKKASNDLGFEMKAFFADQGRIIESGQSFVAGAPIKVLEQWIKRIGLNRFSYMPEGTNVENRVSKLAWALKRGALQANQAGSSLKRGRKAQKISWFYRPYLSLWGKYKQRIFEAYFASLDDQFVRIAEQELNKVSIK